jgi:multicomponent Na+:H+ antiporter subunit A
MATTLIAGIAATFLAGFAAPLVHRLLGPRAGALLGLVPLAVFAAFASLAPHIAAGGHVAASCPWVPALDIDLSFYADGLSLLFLLIISGIGACVVWYSAGYLRGDPNLGKFYLYLFAFMGSMLGVVASDNLVLLFIFWELTSLTSYLLIGYHHESAASRRAALQALLVTGGGGLAMLAGIIVLGVSSGTWDISGLLAMPAGEVVALPAFPVVLVLFLLGAFTKSAQLPFHFWLPNAMEAPAPVSAFLHSATMVKAGVFLLARLHPCFSPSPLWTAIVAPVGAATMLLGVLMALGHTDLKRILAYTTLSALGTLTLLLGIGSNLAIKAAVAYLLAHALYKAALFMTSGTIDHEAGTREAGRLGGLGRAMPLTAAAATLGALSMLGAPLLPGFIGKETLFEALLDTNGPPGLWEAIGVAASLCMVSLAVTTGLRPFWGPRKPTPKPAHEGPWTLWAGPLLLGLAALAFGVFPGWTGDRLLGPAAAGVLGDPSFAPKFVIWHGWTVAVFMSLLGFAGGAILYAFSGRIRSWAPATFGPLGHWGPERLYDLSLEWLMTAARIQTAVIQSGYLRNYILIVGAFSALLVTWFLPRDAFAPNLAAMVPPTLPGIVTCALVAAAGIVACLAKSRFTAILALGVVGLGIAILFYLFSAPDLAMTQILVETLTLVLFVLAFQRLPLLKDYSKNSTRIRDAALATGFGAMMTALVLVAFHFAQTGAPVSAAMGDKSLPLAHGRNVVNVILVDFRALDTFGEITVLAVAALGVLAMLRLRPGSPGKGDPK